VHFTSTDSRAGLPRDYTFTAGDNGVHTYIGRTVVNSGTLFIDGSQPQSPVECAAGTVLRGTGTAGTVTTAGMVFPGDLTPAVLHTGQVNFDADAGGTMALANGFGIEIVSGVNNTIGGTTTGAGNVISGNRGYGIQMHPGSHGNLIEGNYIGTDAGGTMALANHAGGMLLYRAVNNTIGGTTTGAGNVISGNGSYGIDVLDSESNLIQGNYIGTDAGGMLPLPNNGYGIWISSDNLFPSSENLIGALMREAGNVIAHNGSDGVQVGGYLNGSLAFNNGILSNSIFDNMSGLAINLVDNGNNNSPSPGLPSATSMNGVTTIEVTFHGRANRLYTFDFFANMTCDLTVDHAQGERFLDYWVQPTDFNGDAHFWWPYHEDLGQQSVAATATDPDNNTSEFSRCAPVIPRTSSSGSARGRPALSVAEAAGITPAGMSLGVEPTGVRVFTEQTDSLSNATQDPLPGRTLPPLCQQSADLVFHGRASGSELPQSPGRLLRSSLGGESLLDPEPDILWRLWPDLTDPVGP
jgi:hypothetical protein